MLERKIEERLVRYCKKKGVLCYKFNSPSRAGVPDRILIFPGGKVIFLELKATGAKPTPLQSRELKVIAHQGADAYWADSVEKWKAIVDNLLKDPSWKSVVSNRDYLAYV